MVDDQTAFLQGLIDQTPNGTGSNPAEVTLPAGSYRVDGTLRVPNREWLVINAGVGASQCLMVRTIVGTRNDSHISIHGSRHIEWHGGRVHGVQTVYDDSGVHGNFVSELEGQHGIWIQPIGSVGAFHRDADDILIEDFECRDVFGDFVYIAGTLYGPQGQRTRIEPSNIVIRRLLGEKCGRQGIGVNGVLGLIVEDSTIIARRTGVDLENVLSGRIDNVIIRRNAIRTRNGMVNAQSSNHKCNNVFIEDNAAVGPAVRCTGSSIDTNPHRFNWQMLRNIFPGPTTYGKTETTQPIWFQFTDDVVVADNYLRTGMKSVHNRYENGALRVCGVNGVSITDNDFRGQNAVWTRKGECTRPVLNLTESGNLGIWTGTIATHAPYPPQYDPNVDREWFPKDFPQLYPTPFNTGGYWDNLPRGSGLGEQMANPTPLTVSTGRTDTTANITGTVDTAIPFPIVADHLYLAFVAASRNSGLAGNVVIPPSHGGLNWVLEKSLWIGAARRIHIFRAVSTVDLAAAPISLSTAETRSAFWWTVLDWSGVYATGDSADTIRQIGVGTTTGATFVEATFPTVPLEGNAVAGFCLHGVVEPQQIDADHVLLAEGPVAEAGGQWASVDWFLGADATFRWDWATSIHALALTVEVQADTPVGGAGFPQVSVTETVFKTNTTAHQVALPTVDPGDLLLVVAAFDGGPTVTNPTGWVERENVANVNHRRIITARIADGTEGAAVNLATSTAEAGSAQVYRVTGWWGTLDGLAVGLVNTFGGVASNDVRLLAPEWGVEKTLWIAALTVASPSAAINVAYPAGYSNGVETDPAFGSSGALVASARREAAAPSQNPGPFTMTVAPSGSASRLIAVRPSP